MKVYSFLIITTIVLAVFLVVLIGCKYDVAAPQWFNPPATTVSATIDSISPAQAIPGVNIITIYGKNFTGAFDTSVVHNATTKIDTNIAYNGVYFNNVPASISSMTSTVLKVYRPNLATDSATVIVAPTSALVPGKFKPYKISPVSKKYGAIVENLMLFTATVDNAENLYVWSITATTSRKLTRITPTGGKDSVAKVLRAPTDARIGPDGRLYLIGAGPSSGNRGIQAVNLQTGEVKVWYTAKGSVKFGDFDAYGYLYAGGSLTDLEIIAPDSTSKLFGVYAASEILAVRASYGYLYVAAKVGGNTTIWKHSISAGGILGAQEMVLDWSSTGQFASRTIKNIAIAADGTLFLGTNAQYDPILIAAPPLYKVDFFYKGILPQFCPYFCWGNGNYMYLISGNTTPAQEWTVYQVDMGINAH